MKKNTLNDKFTVSFSYSRLDASFLSCFLSANDLNASTRKERRVRPQTPLHYMAERLCSSSMNIN